MGATADSLLSRAQALPPGLAGVPDHAQDCMHTKGSLQCTVEQQAGGASGGLSPFQLQRPWESSAELPAT